MNQLIEPYPKIRIPKKGPESLPHPDGQDFKRTQETTHPLLQHR
jgi:hypothetical protein